MHKMGAFDPLGMGANKIHEPELDAPAPMLDPFAPKEDPFGGKSLSDILKEKTAANNEFISKN